MYLSSKEHDRLQIVVTAFEIPYRSFVATELIKHYPTESSFNNEISQRNNILSSDSNYQTVNSELGKIKGNASYYYSLLQNSVNAKNSKIVTTEINVPNITTLIALTIVFKEHFYPLIFKFKNEAIYLSQALQYKYVRNKLDHRGCKTLETNDMVISIEFINNALLLFSNDVSLFWDKSCEELQKEIVSLQSTGDIIPVNIHNIPEMPFPDTKIVCRDVELGQLKEFVYGVPGAIRKQSSYVLYGYGGVGKTALVLETIKQIVQDLQDGVTVNNYSPEFILFFTAKEEALSFSRTTGKIENIASRYSFTTADELINKIFGCLSITDFKSYTKSGLIIVDNLETVAAEERKKINDFIRLHSPSQVQYIVTSRNEEEFDCRKKIAGFENNDSGRVFIETCIKENDYNLLLTEEDKQVLLDISMGNTLVLTLCLRRLSLNLVTIQGIVADIVPPTTVSKLKKEISQIPANGFNIISEYMFKHSFEEIKEKYKSNSLLLTTVLKIFAVYPQDIDHYTISLLSNQNYITIEPVLDLLCKYLIIEKSGDFYRINPFAEKYIIQLFMPDAETYIKIESEILKNTRTIQSDLTKLSQDIDNNPKLKSIIQDWNVLTNGDKIIVAKAYKLYGEVARDCRNPTKFYVSASLDEAILTINALEQNSMHPYVKFQKARIYKLIEDTAVLDKSFYEEISDSYNDTIWTIKTNPIYGSIKNTKSYASILWLYGMHLSNADTVENLQKAIRYLEEAKLSFEHIGNCDDEYFQCLILLGNVYLRLYLQDKASNIEYLRKARSISVLLYEKKDSFFGKTKSNSYALRTELQKYGKF